MKKSFCLLLALVFSLIPMFSAERIISPVPGKFANKQTLVIDQSDGAECFYSYTSSDPLTSGFAYDGPVVLDADGSVDLFVAVVKSGVTNMYEIRYIVEEKNDFPDLSAEKNFIEQVTTHQLITLDGTTKLKIPETFRYSLGNGRPDFLPGKTLSVSSENNLSRCVPCTVTDGRNYWRFNIFLSGLAGGFYEDLSVPFEIEDWTLLKIMRENLSWNLDGTGWQYGSSTVELDRSSDHTLYWKAGEDSDSSPVQSFVLPARPSLRVEKSAKNIRFKIDGDFRYRMSALDTGAPGEIYGIEGSFTQIVFDTVDGDSIASTAHFALFCDGVYQGNLDSYYELDKRPPAPPEFVANEEGKFVRSDVVLSISAEEGAQVFCAMSAPLSVKTASYTSELENVRVGAFSRYYGGQIMLPASSATAVFYKLCAYAVDDAGNVSEVSEYSVLIDECNYYIDASSTASSADGSRDRPFQNFEQAVSVINSGKFAHFYVRGQLILPDEEIFLMSNCSFTGVNDAHLVFPKNASISMHGASLQFSDFIIEKNSDLDTAFETKLFSADDAALAFSNCEILFRVGSYGTAFSVSSSIVSFVSSGLTVSAGRFASAFSASDSEIVFRGSHVAAIAPSAMTFSLSGGALELKSSDFTVIASLGIIIEAQSVHLRLSDNVFKGEIDGGGKSSAIQKDSKCLVIEDFNNKFVGFDKN